MVAPLAETPAVNCTATQVVLPLASGLAVNVTDTGLGGAELMANVLVVAHAVWAAVAGLSC